MNIFLREAASPDEARDSKEGSTGGALPVSKVKGVIGSWRWVGGVPRGGERGGKWGDQEERAGIKTG